MAFKYALSAEQQTPTSDSKVVLCKSFKIDIAAGSGFTTATTYTLGYLPKDAQYIEAKLYCSTAVSGGTVSAATLITSLDGQSIITATNVFSVATAGSNSIAVWANAMNPTTDRTITYTPTLTGAGATAGVIYINIFYVV